MTALALIPLLPGVGPTELIILLTIILLLFGAKRIPELAKGLGTGIREFKKGTSGTAEKEEVSEGEKKDEELTSGTAGDVESQAPEGEPVGQETHNARKHEEAVRAEGPAAGPVDKNL